MMPAPAKPDDYRRLFRTNTSKHHRRSTGAKQDMASVLHEERYRVIHARLHLADVIFIAIYCPSRPHEAAGARYISLHSRNTACAMYEAKAKEREGMISI